MTTPKRLTRGGSFLDGRADAPPVIKNPHPPPIYPDEGWHARKVGSGTFTREGRTEMAQADQIIADLDRRHRSGAPFEDILEAAVRGLHDVDERFHWTGIYELFPDNVLRLGPFIGAPTDHVFIGVGRGVCGTAVAERRNINVPDVRLQSNYLACSTETRSELVILIRKGERIYAQVDIDSHQVAAFDEGTVTLVQRVADWLATLYESRERLGRDS